MVEHQRILKKVGRALFIVGVIDVAAMVYCISKGISYGSSFNIFAMIAGWFLIRGSLKAARAIAVLAGFMAAAFTGFLVIVPILLPWGFLRVLICLHPVAAVFWLILLVALIGLLVWVYRSLTSPPVRAAMEEAGVNLRPLWRRPAVGIVAGAAMVVLLAIAVPLAMGGKTGREAKAKAAAQVGPGYKILVDSVNVFVTSKGKEVSATVAAYNDHEIREVHLEWTE